MNEFQEKFNTVLQEQLRYLPEITQKALKSFDWATELIGIGKGYGLHIDQLEDLQLETMLVLVGITATSEYEAKLMDRLAISPSEADKIIAEINQRIFTPIHEYILRDGVTAPVTPTGIMESAGMQMTNDETPISVATTPIRQGGNLPTNQSIPDTKPDVPQTVAPLSFNPSAVPVAPAPVVEAPVPFAKEKLEKLYQERMQSVDAALQGMDQPQT